MSSISPTGSYPAPQPQDAAQQLQDGASAYKYEDPTAYHITNYPNQFEVALPIPRPEPEPAQIQGETSRSQRTGSEPKVRLRKACDSCSVRKVKVGQLLLRSSFRLMANHAYAV
jgi:hypothetical protein